MSSCLTLRQSRSTKILSNARPASIHADGDAFALQNARESFARELDPWSLLNISGLPWHAQGVLQAVHTEHRLHAVADAPAEHLAGVPIDDRHQIGKSMCQADVRDVRAPHLVRPDDGTPRSRYG